MTGKFNIQEKINQIVDIVVKNYSPDKIILFGSYARGDATEKSDLDLLIISDREAELPRTRRGLGLRVRLADIPIEKDILFYIGSEVEKERKIPMTLINRIFTEGKVLYER